MSQSMLAMFDGDFADILGDAAGPAEDVLLLPQGVEPRGPKRREIPLRGIFDLASQQVDPGGRIAVISRRPMLALRQAEIYAVLGRGLTKRDHIVVRGITYRVETPEPDGLGGVAVKLLEVAS